MDTLHDLSKLQILCSSPSGIFSISKGDRIAQLLLLPSLPLSPDISNPQLEMGSSGADSAFLLIKLNERPKLILQVNGKPFEGILDTGADRSIISSRWWPKAWPITNSSQSLQGLDYKNNPAISSMTLTWITEEGQSGQFVSYVLDLPVNLWGRVVMQQMELVLSSQYSLPARDMTIQMGYQQGKGLGCHEQGIKNPIVPDIKQDRKGLGFI